MNEPRVKIASQKSGRLADASFELLERCGISFARSKDKLFCYGRNVPVDLLLVRDDDIPQLLLDGVCDLGIVGRNVADEHALSAVAEGDEREYEELLTLDYGECRLSLAIPETVTEADQTWLQGKRIATSYPALTRKFLEDHRIQAKIVKLSGSVEIAPSLGTADCIVDLVSTGTTLRANHLKEHAVLLQSTAVLLRRPGAISPAVDDIISRLLRRIESVQQVKESKYVMLHAPRARLSEIAALLPGAEAPTVLPLEGSDDRVAVHAVCRETVFWEHLEALKSAGASAVLVLPVEKMLA